MTTTVAAATGFFRRRLLDTCTPDSLVLWSMLLGAAIAWVGNGRLGAF